jgi:5-(carboxyamino)imidazole ribonucleotide synthase
MRNLLGQSDGPAAVKGLNEAYGETVKVHVYGKGESKAGRKMGHYTVTAGSLEEALRIDERVNRVLSITGGEA